jgi:heavy metal sensor kinase
VKAPIRLRITAWYALLLTLVLAVVGGFVVVRLRTDLTNAEDRTLRAAVGQIATGYHFEGRPEFHDVSQTVLAGERAASQILSGDGNVVASYGDAVSRLPMLDPVRRGEVTSSRTVIASRGLGPTHASFRVAARAVTRRGRRELLLAAFSLDPVNRSVHRVLVLVLLALPAALLATAAGGWWLARRALRPIDRMTRTAELIGAERLGDRLATGHTDDEVSQLARTLNRMLDRIESAVAEQHQLIADTSHELRTPLAIMGSEIDVTLRTDMSLSPEARETLESTREEIDHMTAIVEDLLTLAAADDGRLDLEQEPTDLQDVASRGAAALTTIAARRNIDVTVDGDAAIAFADPYRTAQAMRNLLANAVDFSPDGGRVVVHTWAANGQVGVDIADEGPGIPEHLRERIFDRFFRGDDSRTRRTGGSGLGLAIAREIALAQAGTLSVEPNTPKGSRFSLALPAA